MRIIYFTAGITPTVAEAAKIAEIQSAGFADFKIRNASQNSSFASGIEECDIVDGTVPAAYAAKPLYDAVYSDGGLASTQVIINDGQSVTVGGSTYTFQVLEFGITAITVS